MLSRRKVFPPGRSRRSLTRKKMFEFLIVVRLTTVVVKAIVRSASVAIAICSWFAISNHCALAAVVACGPGCQPVSLHRQDADAMQCPFHSKPAQQKQEPSQLQCCKILRAVVFAQTKSWARNDAKSFDVDLRVEEVTLVALLANAQASWSLDTGPPGVRSFAELILQRSVLAHAPPAVA
jgi:hypothetical protein